MPHFQDLQLQDKIAAIVLAGGEGTRLYPLTLHRCKPNVCFGGKYRLIDVPISNSINSQIHQIFVISQHFAAGLQKHLLSSYAHQSLQRGNLEVLCPEETADGIKRFLGTADAVRKNIEHLQKVPAEYFLILSGDQLYNLDLIEMVEFARQKNADLVIAALPIKEKEAKRMGLLKISEENKVTDFFEKPQDQIILDAFRFNKDNKKAPSVYLGSMGIYVFRKESLIKLLKEEGHDFGKDLIPKKIKEHNSFAFIYDGYWEDIGTIASYYEANLALTSQANCLNLYDLWNPIYGTQKPLPSALIKGTKIASSIISQGCIIEAEEISHSLIGIRSRIGANTKIKDSIVIGDYSEQSQDEISPFQIGKNCLIEKTIIDEDVTIGNGVHLINKQKLTHYDGDGIFIRDGIIVVSSGTVLPDGFTL